jgi:hypothetical protein
MQFQFHCECGKELVADSGQAGLTVSCPCGRSVEVPTWITPSTRSNTRSRPPAQTGSGLTLFGWLFVIVTVIIVLTVAVMALDASKQLGIQDGRGAKRFGILMVGGTMLGIAAVGAVLRVVFGVRFYRT